MLDATDGRSCGIIEFEWEDNGKFYRNRKCFQMYREDRYELDTLFYELKSYIPENYLGNKTNIYIDVYCHDAPPFKNLLW